MRVWLGILALLCGCSATPGARPLERVREDAKRTRERAMLTLERGLVFPDCNARPSSDYSCGLLATRSAELAIVGRCQEDAECMYREMGTLFASVRKRAEDLGVELDAVELRCGRTCRDLRALEIEIMQTAHNAARDHAMQALLRADSDEREALEREHESTTDFVHAKRARDAQVQEVISRHERALRLVSAEQAPARVLLCDPAAGCAGARTCRTFVDATLGLCEPPAGF